MNIVLMTNTYTPHIGGVAHSVQAFRQAYLQRGHEVLVVAPEFPDMPENEEGVFRIPAIQNFNASDFSVALPVTTGLKRRLEEFGPHIVHSQHPFLLGMTALRAARTFDVPLVFTHHTLYEEYTHYVPGDSDALKTFVIELGTRYAQLCDLVFTPSESIAALLRKRGVGTAIEVIPTGVDRDRFARGDGAAFRREHGIEPDCFVVGHMGRLAAEKNLGFLGRAVLRFLQTRDDSRFLVVGGGDYEDELRRLFSERQLGDRLLMTGPLEGQALVDALHAMDVFAFASRSETQGMVLTEAMAAGLPVVALEANGVREVLEDRGNGRMLTGVDPETFAEALAWIRDLDASGRRTLAEGTQRSAEKFSMAACAGRALECFERIRRQPQPADAGQDWQWEQVLNRIGAEWDILKSLATAGDKALGETLGRHRRDPDDETGNR